MTEKELIAEARTIASAWMARHRALSAQLSRGGVADTMEEDLRLLEYAEAASALTRLAAALEESEGKAASDWTWFNANDKVRVKLTKEGRAYHRRLYDERYIGLFDYTPPKEDAEGWSEWQLHDLMSTFGGAISLAAPVPFETWFQFGKPEFPHASERKDAPNA
jgi:hypothetical protein